MLILRSFIPFLQDVRPGDSQVKTGSGLENDGGMVILLATHRIGVEHGGEVRARL
jgi:hypothetical protein